MSKITLATLSSQFIAEQALTAATFAEMTKRLESQQRQLRAAFARIEELERAPKPRSMFNSTFSKRVAEIQTRFPGSAVKRQGDVYHVKVDGIWKAV